MRSARRPSILERMFPKQFERLREETYQTTLQALEFHGGGRAFTGEKWPGGLDLRAPSMIDHWSLRQNGRKVALESCEARALLNRSTDLVIGTGATLNLEPLYELLGLSAEEAELWARNAEMLFDLWARSPAQNRTGKFCFYEAMRFLFRAHKRDNEYFIRLYYNTSAPSLILPLQFEILDPNQIRGDAYTYLSNLDELQDDGILRDAQGRETTFKVWIRTDSSRYQSVDIARVGPKSGKLYMIHGFTPEFAGQGRGFSEFGLDIQNFKSITDFKLASLEKAKKQSNIVLTAESESDNPTVVPPGFQAGGAGVPVSPPASADSSASEAPPSYHRIPGPQLPPGSTVFVDQPGHQKLKPFESTAPVVGQDEYIKGELEPIFAALGTPLEVAYASFKNNYSASQATLLLNNLSNDVDLFLLAAQAFDPILEMFFACAIGTGRIAAPGWEDPILHAAWTAHRWSRPPMPNIDREKSAKADKLYAEMGADDLESVAMRLNGSSYRSNAAKLHRQYAELPAPPWGWGSKGGASEPLGNDESEERERKEAQG